MIPPLTGTWQGGGIQASVMFYGFDGSLLTSRTVEASAAQTVRLEGNEKAKYVPGALRMSGFPGGDGLWLWDSPLSPER